MKIERMSVCVQKKTCKDETNDKNIGLLAGLGHLVVESATGYIYVNTLSLSNEKRHESACLVLF